MPEATDSGVTAVADNGGLVPLPDAPVPADIEADVTKHVLTRVIAIVRDYYNANHIAEAIQAEFGVTIPRG